MKNVLVTGGCGFIGANFIRHLLAAPDFSGRVINVDRLTYAGNPENLADIQAEAGGRYRFFRGDICDAESMAAMFEQFAIDAVCHFAAESHVDRSILGPEDFIRTNILGTFRLLEVCRRFSDQIELFHHVSTDEVYGSLEKEAPAFSETTAYDPSSPYSASKAGSDHLVRAYHRTYGVPVTITNCSNNYGAYQFPEKLIPLMILNALEEKPLPVYGDGQNVRDWLFVEDHCRAIWRVMRAGNRGETYNIGGRCEMRNLTVVETICDRIDKLRPAEGGKPRRELVTFVADRPGHDRRYAIDCARIEQELGWTPAETFETGIDKTIRWYLENMDWVDRVRGGEYREWIRKHYG
jgi:dTDP-glucose 4,6-dehydratase